MLGRKKEIGPPKDVDEKTKYVIANLDPDEFKEILPTAFRQKYAEQEAMLERQKAVIQNLQGQIQEVKGVYQSEHEARLDEVLRRRSVEAKLDRDRSIILRIVSPHNYQSPMDVRAISFENKQFKTVNQQTGEVSYHPFLWGIELTPLSGAGTYKVDLLLSKEPRSKTPTMSFRTTQNLSGISEDFVGQVTAGMVKFNFFENGFLAVNQINSEKYHQEQQGKIFYLQRELAMKMQENKDLKEELKQTSIAEEDTRQALEDHQDKIEVMEKAVKSASATSKANLNKVKNMLDDNASVLVSSQDLQLSSLLQKRKGDVIAEYVQDLEAEVADKMSEGEIGRVEMRTEDRLVRSFREGAKLASSNPAVVVAEAEKAKAKGGED
jgi:hypothetical protein